MRGDDPRHDGMFSYITPKARVRADHPLRPIRRMTDAALAQLSPRFDRLYSTTGRPSIPPEKLLRALLLQILYSIRSERLLMEELDYSVLYRWFVGLSLDDPIWDATTFTKNRERLLQGDIADAFFAEVLAAIKGDGLLSDEHFTVAADKAYDVRAWVAAVRRMRMTPHVAQNAWGYGGSAIDARTTRHPGYRISHRKRKLIEQAFGWLKTVALFRKLRHRGGRLVDWT